MTQKKETKETKEVKELKSTYEQKLEDSVKNFEQEVVRVNNMLDQNHKVIEQNKALLNQTLGALEMAKQLLIEYRKKDEHNKSN